MRLFDLAIFVRAFEGGGAQRDALLLANALVEAGVRVLIITLNREGAFARLVDPRICVIQLRARKLRTCLPALREVLLETRPAAMLSSEAACNVVVFSATRSLPKNARPRLVLREVASPSAACRSDPYLQNRLAYRLIGPIYSRADCTLVLAAGTKTDLVTNFGVPAGRIRVASANSVLDPETERRLARAALDAHPRTKGLMVSVGRLSPEKNQRLAIEALRLIPESVQAQLALVGDGPDMQALVQLAGDLGLADRVRFVGFSPDPFELLLRAELAVCTSRFEGFGNAIVEALACGTSVVSTDCPWGPREILDHGRFGTLVTPGNPEALAKAMTAALVATPDRAALRARASSYTSANAARELRAILAEL